MRLFTGIDIPDEVKQRLDALISRLRPTARLRWSPVRNLHITTKFIGEWPEARFDELGDRLAAVTADAPLEISVRGLGWFPNPHNPRIFWAAVHASPSLAGLAAATDAACEELGIARESRPYSPHLTLARISQPVALVELRKAVAALEDTEFGTFRPLTHHLYLSEPGPSGSVYTSLRSFALPST